jgi:uncharacterized membrane protein
MFKRWCLTGICLLLACTGLCWFFYQVLYVPQRSFISPDWGDAQWIQAADAQTPTAYFRVVTTLDGPPDAAFVTIAATQVFRLYINGTLVGTNATDFANTGVIKAYMYDILSLLVTGSNVVGVRVANADQGPPRLRVAIGVVQGTTLLSHGSGSSWLATARSDLVYGYISARANDWARSDFIASAWYTARSVQFQGHPPMLAIPPALYEHPVAVHWLSAGGGQETYLTGTLVLPAFSTAWLRLAAVGTAQVYLNGSLILNWQGQAPVPRQHLISYLSSTVHEVRYRQGLAVGIYPVTPYLHAGQNILAIHVQAPSISAAREGLQAFNAALSFDLLTMDAQGRQSWITSDAHYWHASTLPVADWLNAGLHVQSWSSPVSIGRPGVTRSFYLPTEVTDRSVPLWMPGLWLSIVLPCSMALIGIWFLLARGLVRRYLYSYKTALHMTSLVFIPPLACEGLLIVLSAEPLFPSFYTWHWGLLLLLLLMTCYAGLRYVLHRPTQHFHWHAQPMNAIQSVMRATSVSMHSVHARKTFATFILTPFTVLLRYKLSFGRNLPRSVVERLRRHWPLAVLLLVVLPFVSYGLSYEPYWQDELSSYYAAQGILAHALPFFPSGFLYEKAELFSYLLAFWQWSLGAPSSRLLSVLGYLISLPLLYYAGCYLFERRCALLATTMLAFSPSALLWSRQVRMYELAQVLLLLTLLLLCRALEQQQRRRSIYLAMSCMLVMYLCHEETFIALPGFLIAVCVCSYTVQRFFPTVCYRKHWWWSALFVGAGIVLQLWLTRMTHPPVLGTDSSQRPMIQFTFDNIPYYLHVLLFPMATNRVALPDITLNTLLAFGGTYLALRGKQVRARFCALFWFCALISLMVLFTMRAERYLYPLLPVYYLLGASMLLSIFSTFWRFFCTLSLPPGGLSRKQLSTGSKLHLWQRVAGMTASVVFACLLLVPLLPLSNANILLSRIAGIAYHHHYPDYNVAGQYVRAHWRSGDVLICVAPDFSVFYYANHADYFLSIDRALFLLERDGHIIDTSMGAHALLQEADLLAVLANHNRIWIVSDNGVYQAQAAKRFAFPSDVHLVFEGYGSAVYLRDG